MTQDIKQSLDVLNDIMANVSASYAVWRELTDAVNRKNYEEIKSIYEGFFITIDYSNFAMIINGLNMLFENNSKTHNLRASLNYAKKICERLDENRIDQWLSQIDSWSPTTKKIIILRSNIFSHRGGKGTSNSFMKKAAITPNEIEPLISNTEYLLKEITETMTTTLIFSYTRDETKASTQDVMSALMAAND